MKRTIEMDDDLQEWVDSAIDELKDLLTGYLDENPDIDDLPCLSNDLDYSGAFHEIVDGCVPIYTQDIEDAFYLHGDELEEAYENAGIGNKNEDNWKGAAIYCYIEQKCWDWWNQCAQDIFDEWIENREEEKEGVENE